MAIVTFVTRENLDDAERSRLVERVEALAGVERAMPLKPNSRHPAVRAHFFAEVASEDPTILERVVANLRRLPGVESASIPAQRFALDATI